MLEQLNSEVEEAVNLLKALISTPSFSGEEGQTADIISTFLSKKGVNTKRVGNNVWAFNKYFDGHKPNLLLNSHHDTVKPNSQYTRDPFNPFTDGGRIYGLGSNDAGAPLVSLMSAFMYFYDRVDMPYNLILLASAEEENSGDQGIRLALNELPKIDLAIVGEPTSMRMAVAEKGLLVIDAYAQGKAGHVAHGDTENAIYQATRDIAWISSQPFKKVSELLGDLKCQVTQINGGIAHNMVPEICHFLIDVRVTDAYRHEEVLQLLKEHCLSELQPRSMKHRPSAIGKNEPIVKAAGALGMQLYGSSTMSDQTALSCPSVKLGPGDTLRSHTADEFVYIAEIEEGIKGYVALLNKIL